MTNDVKKLIYDTMDDFIRKFHVDENPTFKRMKVLLRHSASLELGEDPELFGWLTENIPEEIQNSGSGVSYAEQAIYAALTLYQVGPQHKGDHTSIGAATRIAGIDRGRLLTVETAEAFTETRRYLWALLRLIKSKGQSIDYRTLACDLCELQFDKIRTSRKWERDFARKGNNK